MVWKNIYIPIGNIKKQNDRFYRIYMPENTTGAGLFFLHPAKLVRPTKKKFSLIGYNDEFKFSLFYEKDGQMVRENVPPITSSHFEKMFAKTHLSGIEKLAKCS